MNRITRDSMMSYSGQDFGSPTVPGTLTDISIGRGLKLRGYYIIFVMNDIDDIIEDYLYGCRIYYDTEPPYPGRMYMLHILGYLNDYGL